MVCSSHGTCKVRLKLQQFSADLTCHVVELADAYEVILGEDWLSKYSATLSWGHRCCVLTKGSQLITLVSGPASGHDDPVHSVHAVYAAPLTAVQANRAWTQGCHVFFAVCTDAQPAADAFCAAVSGNADAQSTVGQSELDAVLLAPEGQASTTET